MQIGTIDRRLLTSVIIAALALPWIGGRAGAAASKVSRAAAFLLGDRLSLAALLYAQGKPADVAAPLAKAQSIATALGVPIKPFPTRPETAPGAGDPQVTAEIIDYLIAGDGWSIAALLAQKYDRSHSVLFEISVKSNLLLILYQPGDDSGIANVIKSRSAEIELPPALTAGLVQAVESKRSAPEVHRALLTMHRDVSNYLLKGR